MSFKEDIKRQEEEGKEFNSNKGGWFSFVEGENRFRVLTKPIMIFERYLSDVKKYEICYTDCGYEGSSKFMMYILDRADNNIKVAKLPYIAGTTIGGYEDDADYKFEGFPMPYDIKIIAIGAGKKEVKYTVIPGRDTTPCAEEIMSNLAQLKSVADIIRKMKDNKKEEHIANGMWQANQEAKAKLKKEIGDARVVGGGKVEDAIPYPEDEISPEDIPF